MIINDIGIRDNSLKTKIFPFDINQNANLTYFENFKIKPNEILIEGFSLNDYENLIQKNLAGNNTTNTKIVWTMSPPCQPFTRQGNMEGLEDNRSTAFIHLIQNIFMILQILKAVHINI